MGKQNHFARLLPFAAYFNICFFWGTSTVANKLGSSALHPLMVGTVRFLAASLLILLGMAVFRIPIRINRNDMKVLGIGSFLMYFCNTLLLLFAAVRVDAGISTIMLCLIPIVMVLVDSLAQRRLGVGKLGLAGILGGFIGIAVVSVSGMVSGGIDLLGILLLLASVLVWCAGTIFLKFRSVSASFPMQLLVQSALPAAAFFVCALYSGNFHPTQVNLNGALPAIYMGVTDSIIGLSSYIYLLKRWKTSVVSTYAYINPVVGLALSALILHESITAQKVAGMVLILLSVLVIQKEDTLAQRFFRKKQGRSLTSGEKQP